MFELPAKIPLRFNSSNGEWKKILSPNDHTLLTEVQYATEIDINFILNEIRSRQNLISKLKPFERSHILKNAAHLIQDNQEFLANIIAMEGGKPLKDARIEAQRAVVTLELCAEETLRLGGEVIPLERTKAGENHMSFTIHEPIGSVLAISAFNHPLNLLAHQVGCALAAGCSVVLKPAPTTPLSAYFFEEILLKAGLPTDGIRVIHADIPLIQKLASSSEFDFISFVGSAKVGWELRKIIAPGTRLSLEHGGQACAIVRGDAEIKKAIPALLRGAFYHAGQVCISTQIIYVHETIYDEFLNDFKVATEKLITGAATSEATDVGPLIRSQEVQRIQNWITEAVALGAKVITGNTTFGQAKQFLTPTIITQVPLESKLMKEEIFGPVVCIRPYQSDEEVLNQINQNEYIFESSLFTENLSKAFEIAKSLSTMTLVINNHTAFRVDNMPFGGHKKSGLGMGGVSYAIQEMSRLKQIILKT